MHFDRRKEFRYDCGSLPCLLAGSDASAVTHMGELLDISQHGGRLGCDEAPALDQQLSLVVKGAEERPIAIRVVRVEPSTEGWRYQVAFNVEWLWPYDVFSKIAFPEIQMNVRRAKHAVSVLFR